MHDVARKANTIKKKTGSPSQYAQSWCSPEPRTRRLHRAREVTTLSGAGVQQPNTCSVHLAPLGPWKRYLMHMYCALAVGWQQPLGWWMHNRCSVGQPLRSTSLAYQTSSWKVQWVAVVTWAT